MEVNAFNLVVCHAYAARWHGNRSLSRADLLWRLCYSVIEYSTDVRHVRGLLQVMSELEAVDDQVAAEMSELDAAGHRLSVIKQQQMELLLEAAKEREDVRFYCRTSCYYKYSL